MRPESFFFGNYTLSAEQILGADKRFGLDGALLLYHDALRFNLEHEGAIDNGWGALVTGRYYFIPTQQPGSGLYTGPYVSFKNLNMSDTWYDYSGSQSSTQTWQTTQQRGVIGWAGGMKAVIDGKFVIELDGGIGRALLSTSTVATGNRPAGFEEASSFEGNLDLYARLGVGWRFGMQAAR
ncbi:MAG: hypothetical protein OHK0039_00200 [Bacteroidia bacterium]